MGDLIFIPSEQNIVGDTTITGDLTVTGTSTLEGAVTDDSNLNVAGSGIFTGDLRTHGSVYSDNNLNLGSAVQSQGSMLFKTAGTERMRVTSGGNLAIGSTSEAVNAKAYIVQAGGGGVVGALTLLSGGSTDYVFQSQGRTNSEFYIVTAAASGQFVTGSVAGDTILATLSTANKVFLSSGVNASPEMTVANGVVGVGTPAPTVGVMHLLGADNGTTLGVQINATTANITASDTFIDFRSNDGSIGSVAGTAVSGTIAYNTFLGSHFTKVAADQRPIEVGTVLEVTGKTIPGFGDHLAETRISRTKGTSKIYGVYGGTNKEGLDMSFGVGAGVVLVHRRNGNMTAGSLLESDGNGCASAQQDETLRSSTLGKLVENVDWSTIQGDTKLAACVLYAG